MGTPSCGTALPPGSLTSAAYQQSYGYDNQWRLTTRPAGSYTYGDSAHPHGVTSTDGGYTASYDAVGNMTCRAPSSSQTCSGSSPTGQRLHYDAERHLVQWQSAPSGAQQYTQNAYDGDGDRVWEQATNGSTTTTTIYLGQLEEIATTGSTTTVTKYSYAGQRRLAVRVGNTLSYLVADGCSSVTEALDDTGNLVATQLYSPYGGIRYQSGTMPTNYGFTGLRLDASGLIVARSRFYDPVAGQYTEGDDALPGGGAILGGLNRYAYVVGNPETVADETGHWPWDNVVAAVTNVVQAVAPAVANVVQAAAPGVASVANATLGIADMVNDVKTLFNPNASWQDKFGSVVNRASTCSWMPPLSWAWAKGEGPRDRRQVCGQ